jgi:protein FrlC
MIFAAMNFHYVRYSLERFMDDCVASGFRDIELWAAAPHFNIDDVDGERLRRLRREIEARTLTLRCITPEQCVYPVNLSIQDDALRRRSVAYFRKTIDIAAGLECRQVLITPGYGYFEKPKKDAWRLCAESLAELSAYAADAGVILFLECLLSTTSNVLNKSRDIAEMIRQVDSSVLFAMLDVNQMADAGETVRDYIGAFGDKLRHVHFIDGEPNGHLALGDGNLPLERYISELQKADYGGVCSLEICDRRYYKQPEKALRQSAEWLKKRHLLVYSELK